MKKECRERLQLAMAEQGYTTPEYKVEFVGEEIVKNACGAQSDLMLIYVRTYAPKKRKATAEYCFTYNYVKDVLDFSKTKFRYLEKISGCNIGYGNWIQ